ncbi:SDR family oxidoreductase [Aspergillus undulatus]|uniref:SDR family oxidoreductase n=1 Tax=Aspergillus undulatus TaxID=1810928 RepID=UPI003CCD42BE
MAPPFPSATKTWHSTAYPSISPTKPSLSAKGKTILITGGGTGIGAETARSFAVAGASNIALLGRRIQPLQDTKDEIEKNHPDTKVFVASTDVTKKEEVDDAFNKFIASISASASDKEVKIDVVVSNAAATGPFEAVADVDPSEFITGVNVNLLGALHVAQAFTPLAADNAVVIDINSNAAHLNYAAVFASYSIAKWSTFRLWDMLGFVNQDKGWRVYHTQPGVVDTDMNRLVGGVKALGYEDHVSLPGNFNVWLASPEAKFLNGKFLYTNWDVDELKAREKELESTAELSIGLVGWPFSSERWKAKWDFVD